jgi:CDP-diacylglycerol--serine O-phosphatidyltransferase
LKKHIPNAITSCNLLCGCIAIHEISNNNYFLAALLVIAAAIFDFFDGMSARLLKVGSSLGAQLDSLADMVTFGVVPSYMAFHFLLQFELPYYLNYTPFLIAIFSAIRLAKFNIDDRQSESFIGVPTPANALLWISIPLISWQQINLDCMIDITFLSLFFENKWVIISLSLIMSYLLIAEFTLLSLKFKSLKWRPNKNRWLLILFSTALLCVLFFAAIPFILILYLLLSIIENKQSSTHEIQS